MQSAVRHTPPVLMATLTRSPLNSSCPGLLLSLALLNTTPALSCVSSRSGHSAAPAQQHDKDTGLCVLCPTRLFCIM
jgi:hypothetical protein